MPILNVQIVQGKSRERKQAFLNEATRAVAEALAAPVAAVRILIDEVSADNVMTAGKAGVDMVLIRLSLILGRSPEAKAAVIAALNAVVEKELGVGGDEVRVILYDIPNTDMGMADGATAKSLGR